MSFLGIDVPETTPSQNDQTVEAVPRSLDEPSFFSTSLLFGHVAYFTFRRPPITQEEFDLYSQAFRTYYDTHERFLFFFDVRDLEGMNEAFIGMKIQLLADFKPRSTKQVKGTAIVLQSDGVRQLLNMLFKVYKLTTPHALFTDDKDASTWIMGQLATTFGEDELMRQLEN